MGTMVDILENLQNSMFMECHWKVIKSIQKKAASIEKKKCSSVRVKISDSVGHLIRLYFP